MAAAALSSSSSTTTEGGGGEKGSTSTAAAAAVSPQGLNAWFGGIAAMAAASALGASVEEEGEQQQGQA